MRHDALRRAARRLTALLLLAFAALALSGCSLPRFAIVEDPLSPQEHLNLGVSYESNGEYDLAIREYEKASRGLDLAYVYLGNAWYQKKDFDKAQSNYEKAVRKMPDNAEAHNNLAWVLYERGKDLARAEKLARRAVELKPDDANYQDTLSKILEAKSA